MSNKRIPNLSVTDGFDFVKKIWGSLPIPSVMNPTTDLDELDKRISDLKAVEQWLNVNLSMLRATIQGLEVQRGTIATIKSFGSNLGLGGERAGSDVNQAVNEEIIRNAVQSAVAPPPVPRMSPLAPKAPEPEPDPMPKANTGSDEPNVPSTESSKAIISNATAWWGLLQDQFNKVAAAAMSGSGLGEEPGEPPESGRAKKAAPSTTPKRKPSASKPKASSRSKSTTRSSKSSKT
ncbi:PhaM family polyhydroxyalkanoate granule multifunctional regulatory protein [Limnobacter sp.]|uniref:PhaM family polyhydroxyalkanoate granule multifunctional regulatory protein n=1 Tax=Limnobacter sp. TaxID=2003368 RepID=UPI003516120F